MTKRIIMILTVLLAVTVIAVPASSGSVSGGPWLSLGRGKSEIKSELSYYNIGSRFSTKVDLCSKPSGNKVRCYFQMRQKYQGTWMLCFGTGTATKDWSGWVGVKLQRGWIDKCYATDDPSFI